MSDDVRATQLAVVAGGQVVPLPLPLGAEEAGPIVAEEQLAYARLLDGGMKIGMLTVIVTILLYFTGALPPHVPVDDLPRYWSLPVKEYLAATGIEPGWAWVTMVHRGEFLNFIGIALLSTLTIVCYAAIVPIFFRRGDSTYGWLCVAEIAVLSLAASGVLSAGGH